VSRRGRIDSIVAFSSSSVFSSFSFPILPNSPCSVSPCRPASSSMFCAPIALLAVKKQATSNTTRRLCFCQHFYFPFSARFCAPSSSPLYRSIHRRRCDLRPPSFSVLSRSPSLLSLRRLFPSLLASLATSRLDASDEVSSP
jgi:hypothetical protein